MNRLLASAPRRIGANKWRRLTTKLLVASALVASAVAVSAPPASASGALIATGDIFFEGDAALATFPCDVDTGGPCGGLFKGMWAGSLEGLRGDDPFVIHWRTVPTDVDPYAGRVHAQFGYNETLCPDQVPQAGAAAGFASGTATARAGTGEVIGVLWDNLTGLPATIDSIDLSVTFNWTRAGNVAFIDFEQVLFRADIDGIKHNLVTSPQTGEASFVLTDPGSRTGIPDCITPSRDVQGQIAGHVAVFHHSA